jgi:two-component system response regulator FixJ
MNASTNQRKRSPVPDEDAPVFIVEDDRSMRASLTGLLEAHGYAVDAYAEPRQFLRRFETPPSAGCLLVDMRMPQMDGMALLRAVRSRGCELDVIFLTGFADVPMAVSALKAGAFDFLQKPVDADELFDAIGRALRADRRRREGGRRRQLLHPRLATLSTREREILAAVAAASSSKTIARELHISEKTVEKHRANIMKKVGAANTAELVRIAVEGGVT